MDMENLAFIAGSSKHGNAWRAAVGSNCVEARYLENYKDKRTLTVEKITSTLHLVMCINIDGRTLSVKYDSCDVMMSL